MGCCKLTLAEILAHSQDDINAQSEFIKEKGIEKLKNHFDDGSMFMDVPQSWFLTEKVENVKAKDEKDKKVKGIPELWCGNIEVTMT